MTWFLALQNLPWKHVDFLVLFWLMSTPMWRQFLYVDFRPCTDCLCKLLVDEPAWFYVSSSILFPLLLSGGHICMYPGCSKPCYVDANNKSAVFDFCGRTHAKEYKDLVKQMSPQGLSSKRQCFKRMGNVLLSFKWQLNWRFVCILNRVEDVL